MSEAVVVVTTNSLITVTFNCLLPLAALVGCCVNSSHGRDSETEALMISRESLEMYAWKWYNGADISLTKGNENISIVEDFPE